MNPKEKSKAKTRQEAIREAPEGLRKAYNEGTKFRRLEEQHPRYAKVLEGLLTDVKMNVAFRQIRTYFKEQIRSEYPEWTEHEVANEAENGVETFIVLLMGTNVNYSQERRKEKTASTRLHLIASLARNLADEIRNLKDDSVCVPRALYYPWWLQRESVRPTPKPITEGIDPELIRTPGGDDPDSILIPDLMDSLARVSSEFEVQHKSELVKIAEIARIGKNQKTQFVRVFLYKLRQHGLVAINRETEGFLAQAIQSAIRAEKPVTKKDIGRISEELDPYFS